MAIRQFEVRPDAGLIFGSGGASFGGDAGLALSDSLIAHESVEWFLDEMKSSCALDGHVG